MLPVRNVFMTDLVISTGLDIEETDRIASLPDSIRARFLNRILTERELDHKSDDSAHYTGIFCAKEAVAKALGCGIGPISWKEIEILPDGYGKPEITLNGNAKQIANDKQISKWSISITHSRQYAAAIVVGYGQK